MKTLYKNRKGVVQTAEQWLFDMGGIECVIGRQLFGAATDSLIASIMAENGLSKA